MRDRLIPASSPVALLSLHAGELSGEQGHWVVAQRKVRAQRRGRVDVRVPVDRAVAEEFSVL
jgi:hypothetical protein